MDATRAWLLFHTRSAVRLTTRAAVPLAALLVGAVGLSPAPGKVLEQLAHELVSGPGTALALSLLGLVLAGWAGPRLAVGESGWAASLPAPSHSRRRAHLAALCVAQVPVLAAGIGLLFPAPAFAPVRALSLPLLVLGPALIVLPVRRRVWVAPLGAGVVLLGAAGTAGSIAAALVLALLADRIAGPLARVERSGRRLALPLPVPARIAVRALGLAPVSHSLAAALPLLAAAAFVDHNPLAPSARAGALRMGGGLALAIQFAMNAEALALRRPAWLWERSLPWTAARRVGIDAALLAACAAPLLIATAVLSPIAACALLVAGPALAFRAAGAMRAAAGRAGIAGPLLLEGALGAGLLGLVPWTAALALGLLPVARAAAARLERDRAVTAWNPLRHSAAGDTALRSSS